VSDTTAGATAALDLRILAGNPDAEEVAAVTAVVSAVLEELAENNERSIVRHPDAWQRSQRSLRGAVHAGPGAWRGFSA